MRNRTIGGQALPPEFRFKPTRILYGTPPSTTIYEDALGSKGKAPLDPRLERRLDPIHWASGRSPMDNFRQTSHGVISELTHQFRHEQTPRTNMRKHEKPQTLNTIIKEPPGARKPRVRGYRTPQEVARGAKAGPPTPEIQPDLNKIAQIVDPRRGFRVGSQRSFARFLSQTRPHTIESFAKKHELREEREDMPRIRIAGAEFTDTQLASMPPGYVKELIRRRRIRDSQVNKPRVQFDPRESRGISSDGQFTTMYRPGLMEVSPGRYVKPEQLGITSAGNFGAIGANGQPTSDKWRAPLAIGLAIVGAIAGIMIIRS